MLTIIKAKTNDAVDLRAVAELRASWRGGQADEAFRRQLHVWLESTDHIRTTWLARLDLEPAGQLSRGEPVGMVSVSRYERMPQPGNSPGAWGYLSQLYVVETQRGAGIGRRLVDRVTEHANEQGWSRVVLAPTDAAKPLYARAGFVPAGEKLFFAGRFGG